VLLIHEKLSKDFTIFENLVAVTDPSGGQLIKYLKFLLKSDGFHIVIKLDIAQFFFC